MGGQFKRRIEVEEERERERERRVGEALSSLVLYVILGVSVELEASPSVKANYV